jgi:hypothetical protein
MLQYPVQTELMFLVVLLGTLAAPVVAAAIYQAIGTWRDRRRLSQSSVQEQKTHLSAECDYSGYRTFDLYLRMAAIPNTGSSV